MAEVRVLHAQLEPCRLNVDEHAPAERRALDLLRLRLRLGLGLRLSLSLSLGLSRSRSRSLRLRLRWLSGVSLGHSIVPEGRLSTPAGLSSSMSGTLALLGSSAEHDQDCKGRPVGRYQAKR